LGLFKEIVLNLSEIPGIEDRSNSAENSSEVKTLLFVVRSIDFS
jgi:hypothetical protein